MERGCDQAAGCCCGPETPETAGCFDGFLLVPEWFPNGYFMVHDNEVKGSYKFKKVHRGSLKFIKVHNGSYWFDG